MAKFEVQVLNDETLKKLKLKNRYSFLNNNLQTVLAEKDFDFLKKWKRFGLLPVWIQQS